MTPNLTAQWTESGEPIIPAEWYSVPELHRLRDQHGAGYMKVIVLLNAYRSPYRNPARQQPYRERVQKLFADWPSRWGSGFRPKIEVLATSVYQQAESVYKTGIYDPLWETLLVLEGKEVELTTAIANMSFSGVGLDAEIQALSEEDEEDEGDRGKRTVGRRRQSIKPSAQLSAEAVKAQSLALTSLMDTRKKVSTEASELRSQLWREVKAMRQGRASDILQDL